MSRFRYSGINWEQRKWTTAAPVTTLGQQVEYRWPQRHTTDGTAASKGHDTNSPTSDHRPKPVMDFDTATVRAIDIGVYLDQGERLWLELLAAKDIRTRYFIFKDRIFFGPGYEYLRDRKPWTIYPYSGTPHTNHIHGSTMAGADGNGLVWDIGEAMLSITQLQEALVEAGHDIDVDGDYGPLTKAAFVESLELESHDDHTLIELVEHGHRMGKTGKVIR